MKMRSHIFRPAVLLAISSMMLWTGLASAQEQADGMQSSEQQISRMRDRQLERAIRRELSQSPFIDPTTIIVSVQNGVATLLGTVPEWEEIGHAVENAHEAGAHTVRSRLGVREAEEHFRWEVRADFSIRRSIERQLDWSPFVSDAHLDVDVENGVAFLTGTVDDWEEIGHAVENAYEGGARAVVSHLRVREASRGFLPSERRPNDAEIRRSIQRHLTWSPFIDADRVQVVVENGVATLRGLVEEPEDVEHAIENAYEGGAIRVRNQLQVERW